MPLFNLVCPHCGRVKRMILKDLADAPGCPECGSVMERDAQPPSCHVKESLDNGWMVRRVERFSDAEQVHRNRKPPNEP